MISKLFSFFLKKELVLINYHRQTIPLIKNNYNKNHFYFLSVSKLWSLIPFNYDNKWKLKIMYFTLSLLSPKYIIDINWINNTHSLYFLWTKKNPESKFIVIQHGSYIGGIVTDIAHKYTKCDVFFTWGDYFTDIFKKYNPEKNCLIKTFGNPVYNSSPRPENKQLSIKNKSILVAPSAIPDKQIIYYKELICNLKKEGFNVDVREHAMQVKLYGSIHNSTYYSNERKAINWSEYDCCITDISSLLLDAIHFKTKVVFFAPLNGDYINPEKTFYGKNLLNAFPSLLTDSSQKNILRFINTNMQELMYGQMIHKGDNHLIL